MKTLIIGYGKIGAIKSKIWEKLGCEVFVFDTSHDRVLSAKNDGFIATDKLSALKNFFKNDYILDISTPNGSHTLSLKNSLITLGCMPNKILIEKPVVSSIKELNELTDILKTNGLFDKCYVNENYYASNSLRFIKNEINYDKVKEIRLIFVKDRSKDEISNRFIDSELNGFGIEIPHMLACIKYLGYGSYSVLENKTYSKKSNGYTSNGILCRLSSKGTPITIIQSLGKFMIRSSDNLISLFLPLGSIKTSRIMLIKEMGGLEHYIFFDPVPHLSRYHSEYIMKKDEEIITKIIFDDNTMNTVLTSVIEQNELILKRLKFSQTFKSISELIDIQKSSILIEQ